MILTFFGYLPLRASFVFLPETFPSKNLLSSHLYRGERGDYNVKIWGNLGFLGSLVAEDNKRLEL